MIFHYTFGWEKQKLFWRFHRPYNDRYLVLFRYSLGFLITPSRWNLHTTQKDPRLRVRTGKEIACPVRSHTRKTTQKQKWKTKTLDTYTWRGQGKGLGRRWSEKRSVRWSAFSRFFLAMILSKHNMRLNWLVKWSSWSANQAIF